MMLIPVEVKPSTINGLGLFAVKPIIKGQKLWVHNELFEVIVSIEKFARLPKVAQAFIEKFGYHKTSQEPFIVNLDDARYFNHSDNPNTTCVGDYVLAIRDIKANEELTVDYREFDCRDLSFTNYNQKGES